MYHVQEWSHHFHRDECITYRSGHIIFKGKNVSRTGVDSSLWNDASVGTEGICIKRSRTKRCTALKGHYKCTKCRAHWKRICLDLGMRNACAQEFWCLRAQRWACTHSLSLPRTCTPFHSYVQAMKTWNWRYTRTLKGTRRSANVREFVHDNHCTSQPWYRWGPAFSKAGFKGPAFFDQPFQCQRLGLKSTLTKIIPHTIKAYRRAP